MLPPSPFLFSPFLYLILFRTGMLEKKKSRKKKKKKKGGRKIEEEEGGKTKEGRHRRK